MRSIAGRISRSDKAFAGHDDPSLASELDALDASRSREKISLADLAFAIASTDKRDVIAGIEHDVSPQKGSRPFD